MKQAPAGEDIEMLLKQALALLDGQGDTKVSVHVSHALDMLVGLREASALHAAPPDRSA